MTKSVFSYFQILKHEKMGPIPSSNGSLHIALDIAISIVHTKGPWRCTFQTGDPREVAPR